MKIHYLLFSIICVISLSCSQEKKSSTEEVLEEVSEDLTSEISLDKDMVDEAVADEAISKSDSAFINSIIQ